MAALSVEELYERYIKPLPREDWLRLVELTEKENTEGHDTSVPTETEPKSILEEDRENAWDVLERLGGTIEAPEDWSEEHDHYLYGTKKRQDTYP